jgi:hypothetical protein
MKKKKKKKKTISAKPKRRAEDGRTKAGKTRLAFLRGLLKTARTDPK